MKAINYNHRSGSTEIGFRGTALMPGATGEAKVESKQGVIKINADMQKLEPATKFGPEYLTYKSSTPRWVPRPPSTRESGPHDWREAWRSEISTFMQYAALIVVFIVKQRTFGS